MSLTSSIHSSPASSRSLSNESISSGSTLDSSSDSDTSNDSSASHLSTPHASPIRVASTSNLQVNVHLGRQPPARIVGNKENLEVLVSKVVPVVTKTRTLQAPRYWVAVAVGDRCGLIGVGEHVGKTEAQATKRAEKKAFRNIKSIRRVEDRTVSGRITGLSGGDCLSLSQAPRGFGIVTTSGMARKLLPLAGIKDCHVTNCWDKLTSVRALSKVFAKLSRSSHR